MNVLTQNGFKNFEAIIDQGEKSNLLEIMFDDKSNITCTYDHEFLLDDSYIPACFIEIGDVLSKKTVIDIKEKSNSEKVYDLYNVNDTHSYVTNGVISHNCNLLFLDEFAFVEDAATFYTSTYPVISSGKTSRVIITSTANGIGNQFHKIYEGALQSTNEFKPFRVDWWDVPGRDEEWKKQTISNTSELQFQVEFGNTFFGTGNTLISSDALMNMKAASPLADMGDVKVYEEPKKNHDYIMTVDVAKGRGQDYSTFNIIDISTNPFKQVACYRNNMISPILFPDIIHKWAKRYNEAYAIIESNDAGSVVANGLYYDIEYENVHVESMIKAGAIGMTMNRKVKRIGCSNLKDLVEEKRLELVDLDTISECSTFEARGNSFEASDGNHDDLVMNLVMFAWYVGSEAFVNQTDMTIKQMLYEQRNKEIEDDIVPVGIIDDGVDRDETEVIGGDVWTSERTEMF